MMKRYILPYIIVSYWFILILFYSSISDKSDNSSSSCNSSIHDNGSIKSDVFTDFSSSYNSCSFGISDSFAE